jgi:hypothetical protein
MSYSMPGSVVRIPIRGNIMNSKGKAIAAVLPFVLASNSGAKLNFNLEDRTSLGLATSGDHYQAGDLETTSSSFGRTFGIKLRPELKLKKGEDAFRVGAFSQLDYEIGFPTLSVNDGDDSGQASYDVFKTREAAWDWQWGGNFRISPNLKLSASAGVNYLKINDNVSQVNGSGPSYLIEVDIKNNKGKGSGRFGWKTQHRNTVSDAFGMQGTGSERNSGPFGEYNLTDRLRVGADIKEIKMDGFHGSHVSLQGSYGFPHARLALELARSQGNGSFNEFSSETVGYAGKLALELDNLYELISQGRIKDIFK